MIQRLPLRRLAGTMAVAIGILSAAIEDAGAQLAVIPLEHRPAEEIIPVIAPLLDSSDRISGRGFQLFVNTTPENIPRIREVVAHLDRTVRQLAVTVVQGEHALETLNALAVSGRVAIGDGVTVGIGGREGHREEDNIQVDVRSDRRASRVEDIQRVLVQDGGTATIAVGLSLPVVMGSPKHRGVTHRQVVDYRQAVTGFRVTPRVSGNQVLLTVDAVREHPSGNGVAGVRTQEIQTRIQGRLDEWIDLGALVSDAGSREKGILQGAAEKASTRNHVFVRVETLP
ncbi:MAG TPA: hypothetical protein VLT88_10365 [Desulfosarcina sp.]|nr:hypothetical protein [Desulfosarcina sp.]